MTLVRPEDGFHCELLSDLCSWVRGAGHRAGLGPLAPCHSWRAAHRVPCSGRLLRGPPQVQAVCVCGGGWVQAASAGQAGDISLQPLLWGLGELEGESQRRFVRTASILDLVLRENAESPTVPCFPPRSAPPLRASPSGLCAPEWPAPAEAENDLKAFPLLLRVFSFSPGFSVLRSFPWILSFFYFPMC